MDKFEGKVAVITGAGSGIGRALVAGFANEGATVVAADIDLDSAAETAAAVGDAASAAQVDVADPDSVLALADSVFAEHGQVDILINNAGVFQGGLMWERSFEDYHWNMDVNVFGIIHAVKAFVPRMIAQDTEGHIVNTASVAAFVAGAGSSPYVVSKCAAFSTSECLALDLAAVGSKIKASVLTPSAINTGIAHTAKVRQGRYGSDESPDGAAVRDGLAAMTSTGIDPEDVVEPVLNGIRTGDFLIPTKPSYREQLTTRFEALLDRQVPPLSIVD